MAQVNWHSHIDEHKRSGLTVAEYCDKHRLGRSAFYLARKRLKSTASFTPLVIKDASMKSPRLEVTLAMAKGGLIEFRGFTSDANLLSALLKRAVP